jgi:hypothetical protein
LEEIGEEGWGKFPRWEGSHGAGGEEIR